jgi:hypothetical protein
VCTQCSPTDSHSLLICTGSHVRLPGHSSRSLCNNAHPPFEDYYFDCPCCVHVDLLFCINNGLLYVDTVRISLVVSLYNPHYSIIPVFVRCTSLYRGALGKRRSGCCESLMMRFSWRHMNQSWCWKMKGWTSLIKKTKVWWEEMNSKYFEELTTKSNKFICLLMDFWMMNISPCASEVHANASWRFSSDCVIG